MSGVGGLTPPPGYGAIVPLDREKHRGLGVREAGAFGADLHAIYITAHEILRAARDYPVVFVKDNNGAWFPMVLTGLRSGQNLFVDANHNWLPGRYVPAYVRRYPFCTLNLNSQDSRQSFVVCVEERALSAEAPPLFGEDGGPGPQWQQRERLIQEMESARVLTEDFALAVAAANLLEPFEAHAHPTNLKPLRIKGLYRVSEDRLNRLPGKTIKNMMAKGQLSRVYAHLMSLDNFATLLDLYAERAAQG